MYFCTSQCISLLQGHRFAPATLNNRRKIQFWVIVFFIIHGFSAVNRVFASRGFFLFNACCRFMVCFLKGFESVESAKNIVIAECHQKF